MQFENPALSIVEINLKPGPSTNGAYWWHMRLYLLAALGQGFSRIARFVFVEGDADRRYIGMISAELLSGIEFAFEEPLNRVLSTGPVASPGEVRTALAGQAPELEDLYRLKIRKAGDALPGSPDSRVIVNAMGHLGQKFS